MRATLVRAVVVAVMALVALWAFVSYLQPSFTGDLAQLWRCN